MTDFRCCAIVPTFENPETVRRVVERIRVHLEEVIVVDDGSSAPGREACAEIASLGLAQVIHSPRNQGKGAAMRTGFRSAGERGFTHAIQIDADGQHDTNAIPRFVEVAREAIDSAVFATPVYDESAPRSRRVARQITHFWVNLEVGPGVIDDALIGFRLYPLAATLSLPLVCNRMAFDVESAVQLAWAGVPIRNLEVGVRYLTEEEGGRSHFRLVRDNLSLSWLHARLCIRAAILSLIGRGPRKRVAAPSINANSAHNKSPESPPHSPSRSGTSL
jgi:glycosyltransferase involved in cell wall biosynthesis